MTKGTNASEIFVAAHCDRTFLSLWGMANPLGRDASKELCDYLVVCDPDVVIVSVKDIGLGPEPEKVEIDRWFRKAIQGSAKQVYGAERLLGAIDSVRDRAGRILLLPPAKRRRVHRVCVAFGSKGDIGLKMGDFGRGFVHVLEERSFPILLRELDTIGDLTDYLEAKRVFFETGKRAVFPGEEHILAFYISKGRTFPTEADTLILDDTCWPGLTGSADFKARLAADQASYAWDNVIEYISKDLTANDLLFVHPPTEAEAALRVLAREHRFHRRFLGENLTEVLLGGKVHARMIQSLSGVAYVLMASERSDDREYRIAELTARCKIARATIKDSRVVVGIASERGDDGVRGLSFDVVMIDQPILTAEDEKEAAWLRDSFGYFKSPQTSTRHVEEYPTKVNPSTS